MANAARAPFYAPRPGDDVYWMRGPIANGAVRLTTTQVKFYGQPGQAPTKRWAQWYTFDDPGVWQLGPLSSDTIHPLLTAAGRVKPYRWLFDQDDASVWWGWTNRNSTALKVTAASPFISRVLPSFNDEPGWTGHRNWISVALTAGASQALSSSQWRFIRTYGTDDASTWQWTYQRSTLTPTTFGFNLHWGFNSADETGPWQPTLENLNSSVVQILSSGGQPHTKQTTFTLDDPSVWFSYLRRNQPALTPSGTPTKARQATFATDDQPAWQWTPPSPLINQLVTFTFPSLDVPYTDDASFWSWSALPRSITLATPAAASPFIPRQWPFSLASDEPWQRQSSRSQPLSILAFTPFSPRFIPTLDEPPGWTSAFRPVSLTLTATTPTPFAPTQWHFSSGFGNDDAGVWNAQSHNAFFTQTQPFSFVSSMWNLNIPQDTPMPISSLPSTILYMPAPSGVTLIQRTLTGVGL